MMENLSQPLSKPSSPASPFFANPSTPRSFINFNPDMRGQSTGFPQTSLLEPPPGSTYAEFLRTWTDSLVARWLNDIKCGDHAETFKANDIRGDILLELDQVILKEMGVSSVGDRLRILNAVKKLRQNSSSKSTAGQVLKPTLELTDDASATSKAPKVESSTRSTFRRLEIGRPAPLQLGPHANNDLPALIREQPPDSARGNGPVRPLPQQPNHTNQQNLHVTTPVGTHSTRPNLPPLPPPPRNQPPPPPPPNRTPVRVALNHATSNGRATPTPVDPPPYTSQALPPPPQNQSHTQSSGNNWAVYNSPGDPRVGNVSSKSPNPRSTSPLPIGKLRANHNIAIHGRNGSLGAPLNISSPIKAVSRPSPPGHPYAIAQPTLLSPPNIHGHNLSPIDESFTPSSTPFPTTSSSGRGSSNQTSSNQNAPYTLDDLKRKIVKFYLPDEGPSFITIDVTTFTSGHEVLEKVLKKFGKGGSRSTDADNYTSNDERGLIIDGWGVYLDDSQANISGEPLTEDELMYICHAPPDHPKREHGLTLRRTGKPKDSNVNSLSPAQTSKSTKRASSISVLSGLGVPDPEKALDTLSPTSEQITSAALSAKRPNKLRNFFGQRPPSELITNHLTEYFPFTEKKVLERTARHSIMRSNTILNRESASFNNGGPSRFSVIPSQATATSPTRNSFSVPNPENYYQSDAHSIASSGSDIPRMSLSTEDGRSLDLHADVVTHTPSPSKPQLLPPIPFPTESFSESLEGITGLHRSRPVSRASSTTSRRMSYITELRSKRDRSDTASLMTVDEITAEVESRRASKAIEHASSSLDDWTEVTAPGSVESAHETLVNDEEMSEDEDFMEDEEEEEGATLNLEESEESEKPVFNRKASKWIKGALIGAGSFGKVYLGMDASSGLLMAVKQVELPTGSAPNQERKKSMLSALEREIELLKNLQHENIVQYLYSSIDDEYLNIFLEYVPGGSVTALLSNYGAFEEPLVRNFVRQILQGLDYLHERDIIHRDIKGANILVDNKGGIKISDFGISKKVDDNLLANHRNRPSLQGSVFWMAPEVVKQCGHTKKADIWSVGCLVVEMLTGEHPWAQLTQMQAIFKIGSSAKPTIPSDISAEAQDFLQKTFELDYESRPSATELLQHVWIGKKQSNHTPKSSASKAAGDV